MIHLIERLEKNHMTYIADGNVYFDISKFKAYGKLANLNLDDLQAGARIDVDKNKKNPHDFVLWFTKSKFQDQEMKWDATFEFTLTDEEYEKLKEVAANNKNVEIITTKEVEDDV